MHVYHIKIYKKRSTGGINLTQQEVCHFELDVLMLYFHKSSYRIDEIIFKFGQQNVMFLSLSAIYCLQQWSPTPGCSDPPQTPAEKQ